MYASVTSGIGMIISWFFVTWWRGFTFSPRKIGFRSAAEVCSHSQLLEDIIAEVDAVFGNNAVAVLPRQITETIIIIIYFCSYLQVVIVPFLCFLIFLDLLSFDRLEKI